MQTPWFTGYALPRREGEAERAFKIGFVISKKVNKRAVVRNKLKRQLRHACRMLITPMPFTKPDPSVARTPESIGLQRFHTLVIVVKPALVLNAQQQLKAHKSGQAGEFKVWPGYATVMARLRAFFYGS